MTYARIVHQPSNCDIIASHNDDNLWMVAGFLLEVNQFFLNWLLERKHSEKHAFGNIFGLIECNDRIYVCLISDPEEERCKYFNATRSETLDIVRQWVAARYVAKNVKPIPQDIVILQENNKVTIFPMNPGLELTNENIKKSIEAYEIEKKRVFPIE